MIQKLIPQLPILENLLDMFISNSRIEKAFLFDVLSKIYIATGLRREFWPSTSLFFDILRTLLCRILFELEWKDGLLAIGKCAQSFSVIR